MRPSARLVRFAPLAAIALAIGIATPAAAAAPAIHVPTTWGPQALGWGDLVWFGSSANDAPCLALRRDGWTLRANLPWLHNLVVAAPHPRGSVAAAARSDLLKYWSRFGRDASAFIAVGNACPKHVAARQVLMTKIVGSPGGNKAPEWAHRMFELFAVLYPKGTAASCAALNMKVAGAQKDLENGPAKAKYFGRAAMTVKPARWQDLVQTGATCIVHTGGDMEAGIAWGLTTLLGSARAEHFHDASAVNRIRKGFFGN